MLAPESFNLRPTILLGTSDTAALLPSLNGGIVVAGGDNATLLLTTLAAQVSEGFSLTLVNTSATGFDVTAQSTDLINGSLGGTAAIAPGESGVLTMARLDNTARTPAWWLA